MIDMLAESILVTQRLYVYENSALGERGPSGGRGMGQPKGPR
jgi:hypothetical protein